MSTFGTRFLLIKTVIDISVIGSHLIYPRRWPIFLNFNLSKEWCNSRDIVTTLLWLLLHFLHRCRKAGRTTPLSTEKQGLHDQEILAKPYWLQNYVHLGSQWDWNIELNFLRASSWAAAAASGGKGKGESRKGIFHWTCAALSPVIRAV